MMPSCSSLTKIKEPASKHHDLDVSVHGTVLKSQLLHASDMLGVS